MKPILMKIIDLIIKVLVKILSKLAPIQAQYSIDKLSMIDEEFDMQKIPGRVRSLILHDDEVINKRLEICRGCEYLTKSNRCKKCGCFMKIKARLSTASCPIGKWGKEYNFIKGERVSATYAPPSV